MNFKVNHCGATGLLVTALLALASAAPAQAVLLLKVEQIGSNVVVTGSGSVNLTALNVEYDDDNFTNTFTDIQLFAGPAAFADGLVTAYSGLSGPSTIGAIPNVLLLPDDSADSNGNLFGLLSNDQSNGDGTGRPLLFLPQSYTSSALLAGTSFYSNTTYADFGLTDGTIKTWSWGTGATAVSVNVQVGSTPVPAPLGIAGAGAVFTGIKRRRLNSRRLQRHARK